MPAYFTRHADNMLIKAIPFFFIMRFELKYYFSGFKPFLRVRGLLFC